MAFTVETDYGTFNFDSRPTEDDIDEAISHVKQNGGSNAPVSTPKQTLKDKSTNDYSLIDSEAEQRTGLPKGFLNALGHHESGNNINATNDKSTAFGRFQMTDAAWKDVDFDSKSMDKKDPYIQSNAAAAYFANILNGAAGGDYDLALRMYYQGEHASHDKLYSKEADAYVNDPVFSQFTTKEQPREAPQTTSQPVSTKSNTITPEHAMDVPEVPTEPSTPKSQTEDVIDKVWGAGEAALNVATEIPSGIVASVKAAGDLAYDVVSGQGLDKGKADAMATLNSSVNTTYTPTTSAGIRYSNTINDFLSDVVNPLMPETVPYAAPAAEALGGVRDIVAPTSAIPETVNALRRNELEQRSAQEEINTADVGYNNALAKGVKDSYGAALDEATNRMQRAKLEKSVIEKKSGISYDDVNRVESKLSVMKDLNDAGYKGGAGLLTSQDKELMGKLGIDKSKSAILMGIPEKVLGKTVGSRVSKTLGFDDPMLASKRSAAIDTVVDNKINELDSTLDLSPDSVFNDGGLVAPFEAIKRGDLEGAKKALSQLDDAIQTNSADFSISPTKVKETRDYAESLIQQAEHTGKKVKTSNTAAPIQDFAYKAVLPVVTGIVSGGLSLGGLAGAASTIAVKSLVNKGLSRNVNAHLTSQLPYDLPTPRFTTATSAPVFTRYGDNNGN